MTSHYTEGSVTTLHDSEGVLGRPLVTLFGLSQFHGHGSWLVCEVALTESQLHAIVTTHRGDFARQHMGRKPSREGY
jgi:hypothetical protein